MYNNYDRGDVMLLYIREFAEQKKEIERKLSDRTGEVMEHLLYLTLAPNCTTINHWMNEIFAFIHDVDKLRGKNKYPTFKQLYDWTYGKKRDTVVDQYNTMRNRIKNAEAIENLHCDYTIEEITEIYDYVCNSYFTWLCQELSNYGVVAINDVKATIKKILSEIKV